MIAIGGSLLLNSARVEAWPGGLLRARRSADARLLSRADWVFRRKRDGRYLGAMVAGRLHRLLPAEGDDGVDAALGAIEATQRWRAPPASVAMLPLDGLRERLARLGLDADYSTRSGLRLVPEPSRLSLAGVDRFARPVWMLEAAGRAWTRMRRAARDDGIVLDAISAFRNHDYQLGIFERKLSRGLTVEQILEVNAAPGYSEHHSGCALDIGTPGEPPAVESFESTPAFGWLQRRAGEFGFALSYPRGNPHGIVYEPWHWCWHRAGDRSHGGER
jgi:D-alanyl-D-alanine carboxypeptidase